MLNMEVKVLDTISKYNMLQPKDNILVALSGGADSVCLFHFLVNNSAKLDITVYAAHLNHGLRGKESDQDEQYVKDLCAKYNIKLFCKNAKMLEKPKPKGMGTEEWARSLRYDFLYKTADKISAKIATAHSLTDNCETVIFNLARGTGLKGSTGINPVRQNIIRPLIECSRNDIEKYCQNYSLTFVTDSTNLQDVYTRNKIRHNILPVLSGINADYQNAFNRFISSQYEIENYFSGKVEKLYNNAIENENCFKREPLQQTENIILKHFILNKLCANYQLDTVKLGLILQLFSKQSGSVQITTNVFIKINKSFLYLEEKQPIESFEIPFKLGKIKISDKITINCKLINNEEFINFVNLSKKGFICCANYDKIKDIIIFRNPKQGDSISLYKRNGTKTLKKLFNEDKLLPQARKEIPVLSANNKVIWVYNYGFDKNYIADTNTQRILLIETDNNKR